jgi:Uma2 family endonuclease
MSGLETLALELPTIELIYEDGEPLESNWHRIQINLLIDTVRQAMAQRGRSDFFAGGNMFVYFSFEQARVIATQPPRAYRHFRGPDFFFVGGVEGARSRNAWVVWDEGGRYPDIIIELLSPSTAQLDKTTKKQLYERTFRTPEYFCYDPIGDELQGWRLLGGTYQPVEPDAAGRLWSQELELWLGRWQGEQTGVEAVWLRFYDAGGQLVPTPAEAERQRAEAAEAEVARLRARLAELGGESSARAG